MHSKSRVPSDCVSFVIILFVYLLLLAYTYTTDLKIVTAGNDMANLIPGALVINDPSLYSNDPFYQHFLNIYPKPFLYLYAWLLSLSGNIIFVNYLLSSLFFLAFVLGTYYLITEIFCDRRVALVCALLCVAVRPALAIKLGIALGLAIPRNGIIALSPWILLYFYRELRKPAPSLFLWGTLFFGIGLLANVHPLTPGHLFLVLIGTMLLSSSYSLHNKIVFSAIGFFSFLLGASPFLVQKLLFVGSSGIAPRELILERAWFILPPYLRNLGNYGLFFLQLLPFLFFGAIGYLLSKKEHRHFAHLGISVVLVSLFTVLEYVWPKAVTFEFLRASVWIYLPLLAYTSLALVELFEGSRGKKIFAVALFFALAWPSLVIAPAQTFAVSIYSSLTGYTPYQYPYADPGAYHTLVVDIGNFMKTSTSKDSIFMIYPRGPSHLRIYGERALVISYKDANIHSKDYALLWEKTYRDVTSAYATNETSLFLNTARRYSANYILVDKTQNKLNLTPTYENDRFVLYTV